MLIRSIAHKGLLRFVRDGDDSGLPQGSVAKLRRIISFLQDMESEEELFAVTTWKAHRLSGDRKGTWSLYVTRNWRLTFRIDDEEIAIIDLNFEDYH